MTQRLENVWFPCTYMQRTAIFFDFNQMNSKQSVVFAAIKHNQWFSFPAACCGASVTLPHGCIIKLPHFRQSVDFLPLQNIFEK